MDETKLAATPEMGQISDAVHMIVPDDAIGLNDPEKDDVIKALPSLPPSMLTSHPSATLTTSALPDPLLVRLGRHVAVNPTKLAVAFIKPDSTMDGGTLQQQFTYAELWQEMDRVSERILEKGLRKGDRAVLVYPPSLEFMVAFLACLKVGVVAVPVFPPNPHRRDTLHMFGKIVQSCQATVALTSSEYNHMKQLAGIRDAFTRFQRPTAAWPDNLQWIVTTGISSTNNKNSGTGDFQLKPGELQSANMDEMAFLQYTSGSTSEPKGVMITHGNLTHNLTIITNDLQASDDTVVVSWLPQYHDMGLIGSYLGLLYCGGTGYYMSPLSFLQRPMLWIEAVAKYRATHLQAPNFSFKLTVRKYQEGLTGDKPKKYTPQSLDLLSVRHVINAAEPVDEESIEAFYSAFGPFGLGRVIFPTYGLAEHTVFVCSGGTQRLCVRKKELEVDGNVQLAHEDATEATTKLVGCGYPARQGVDVRIVDTESLQEVPDDMVGEIWIHSPSKAAGYFDKPQETMEDFHALLGGVDNPDGYLRTGDLGFLHKGELFICGRLKDLIIVGGRNYYPQDLEATAEASSDNFRLGCSAAFSIDPTREGGEEVAIVMELKEPPSPKETERICSEMANQVRAAINQEHSLGLSAIAFLRPRTVPKTSSGKIARAWCRKGFVQGTLDVIYQKSFKNAAAVSTPAPLEIEGMSGSPRSERKSVTFKDASQIRSMAKEEILAKLVTDVSRMSSVPVEAVDKKAPLISMLDSLTISQFKGALEFHYAVKLSDEYLFRESTTLTKLVEVVRLGFAPDDGDGTGADSTAVQGSTAASPPGTAKGLAGALGCPPGVVCVIL